MNAYEFVFITKDGSKNILARVEELIEGIKGKITQKEDWGKKPFTYKMNGLAEGFYHIWSVNLAGSQVKDLKTKLNLEEGVIRYLLLRKA